MANVKPIAPDEIIPAREEQIPDGVIEAFNELIAKNYQSGSSIVKQPAVVNLIMVKMGLTDGDRSKVYDEYWLNIEEIYRKAGWTVEYDKPGYNENYDAFFTFTRKCE
jgi:hypothetical protein